MEVYLTLYFYRFLELVIILGLKMFFVLIDD